MSEWQRTLKSVLTILALTAFGILWAIGIGQIETLGHPLAARLVARSCFGEITPALDFSKWLARKFGARSPSRSAALLTPHDPERGPPGADFIPGHTRGLSPPPW